MHVSSLDNQTKPYKSNIAFSQARRFSIYQEGGRAFLTFDRYSYCTVTGLEIPNDRELQYSPHSLIFSRRSTDTPCKQVNQAMLPSERNVLLTRFDEEMRSRAHQ